ncbi:MAG: hypothetical protein RIC56_18045 [Pseudomonadales bacterium]
MDRLFAPLLRVLALSCGGIAAVLVLAGFIQFLQTERWPDQSLLRIGYDSGLLQARWFLAGDWAMTLREGLARMPTALALLLLAPPCWWLGGRLGN